MQSLINYLQKLDRRKALPPRDRDLLLGLPGEEKLHNAGQELVRAGDLSRHAIFIETGFVSRIRSLEDKRQIVAFHLPGDAVDLQSLFFTTSDDTLEANQQTRSYWVPHAAILEATDQSRFLRNALWLDTLVDAGIFREWTGNLGQRRALARMSHLFLEMEKRSEAIGLLNADSFPLPLTQPDLADALGLSLVHFNKTFQILRKDGLIAAKNGRITILERQSLTDLCGFDPSYLHLNSSRIGGLR